MAQPVHFPQLNNLLQQLQQQVGPARVQQIHVLVNQMFAQFQQDPQPMDPIVENPKYRKG